MKKEIQWLFLLLFISCLSFACCNKEDPSGIELNLTGLKGPYLGQTPPGDSPEIFAPGVVGDIYREHSSALFTPDGTEVFWTRQVMTVTETGRRSRLVVAMHMKQIDGSWTEPGLAPFSMGRWTFVTGISPDGKRLYFDSTRADEANESTPNGWGEPRRFEELEQWNMPCAKVQETFSGNIYFQSDLPKPELENPSWGVGFFLSRLVDGEYQKPEKLGPSINGDYLDYGFFVDPRERFVIFSSGRPGGYSSLDMYISYRLSDGSWGEAINLGEKINKFGVDGSDWPCLSPDGKYLFFMTTVNPKNDLDIFDYSYEELRESQLSISNGGSKIHWVDAGFIEKLKP